MQPHEITTRTAIQRVDEHGMFHAVILPGIEQTLADAQENVRACAQIGGGKRRPLLVDIRQIKSQSREARDYYAGEESAANYSAVAILVGSPISRMIGNFLTGFNRSAYSPVMLFTSEAEAIAWLRTFLT